VSLPRLLFDRNIPDPLARLLTGFAIRRTEDEGWNTLKNGELLDAAEREGFVAMLSADQNLKHQQNLSGRRLALVVLSTPRWTELRDQIPAIQAALEKGRLDQAARGTRQLTEQSIVTKTCIASSSGRPAHCPCSRRRQM